MPPEVWSAGTRGAARPECPARAAGGAAVAACEGRACVLGRGEDDQEPHREAGLRRETMASETRGRPTEEPRRSSRAKQLHGGADAKQGDKRRKGQLRSQGPEGGRRPGDRAPEAALGKPAKNGKRREGQPEKSAEASTKLKVPANLRSLHRQEGVLTFSKFSVQPQVPSSGRGSGRRGRAPGAAGPRRGEVILPGASTAVG